MKSKTLCPVALLVVLGSAMIVDCAQAQTSNSTYLYLANAVPGRSVASAVTPGLPVSNNNSPAYPVDLKVGTVCVAQGVSFGEIRGPLSWPAGVYPLQFTAANAAAPCTGTSVFSTSVTFAANTTYIGVLTLNSSNAVTGQLYTADLTPISVTHYGRIEVINASQDTLVATLTSVMTGTVTAGVDPGNVIDAFAPGMLYTGTIETNGGTSVLVGPFSVQIEQRNSYIYVLTGSTANSTVQLVGPKVIKGVF
jgi:Domain of unknown function (DUF4397)